MADEADERLLVTGSVQLTKSQWRWLQARSEANYSRSAAAELRRVVAAAMKAEEAEAVAA